MKLQHLLSAAACASALSQYSTSDYQPDDDYNDYSSPSPIGGMANSFSPRVIPISTYAYGAPMPASYSTYSSHPYASSTFHRQIPHYLAPFMDIPKRNNYGHSTLFGNNFGTSIHNPLRQRLSNSNGYGYNRKYSSTPPSLGTTSAPPYTTHYVR